MLPPGEGPPGHPPPGYQMMYLMPDGRMMPAHPMAPPRAMMGGPGPHPPPSYLPGPPWGVPAPNWGGAPLPNWGGATQVGGHPQASLGHRHQPPPPPPGAPTGGGPPPWHKATPPPPPPRRSGGFQPSKRDAQQFRGGRRVRDPATRLRCFEQRRETRCEEFCRYG